MSYLPRNNEAAKQDPEAEEEEQENGTNLVARGQRHGHHPIRREVDEAHEQVIVEPQ